MTDLCSNNKKLPLRLSVCCYENSGGHHLYGRVVTSVKEIEMGLDELVLISKRGRRAGELFVDNFKVDMKPSLFQYLRNGWQIDCSIAIDFTLSNRPINDNNSKHRQDLKRVGDMNQYEKAIYEVGAVLQKFAFQGRFTMYGFGGIPRYLARTAEEANLVRCWNLADDLDGNTSVPG